MSTIIKTGTNSRDMLTMLKKNKLTFCRLFLSCLHTLKLTIYAWNAAEEVEMSSMGIFVVKQNTKLTLTWASRKLSKLKSQQQKKNHDKKVSLLRRMVEAVKISSEKLLDSTLPPKRISNSVKLLFITKQTSKKEEKENQSEKSKKTKLLLIICRKLYGNYGTQNLLK